ncbi:DUF305 domain-containing protein [Brevundimonas sp.]|jgi:hypothetical protein|uniref:DUF305 domain-containing protein n=1 Tax=Brevundimonas sp. TaxID=1871086 RepID=UPI00248A128A|nr:DUF305 domain-containing protein [Brevundimonas sp.]MDI1280010.1 DUF305 domain-containing protein [Brevundimonas sp.]
MKRIGWASVIALFLALSAFAFGLLSRQPSGGTDSLPPMDARPIDTGSSHGGTPADSSSTRAFREANAQMHRDMSVDYTGDADIDFLRVMIANQEGALAMARIAVEHGEAPEVRSLAEEIIAGRDVEIVRMKVMLARHEDGPVTAGKG